MNVAAGTGTTVRPDATAGGSPVRVLLAKPGLDGHDRGVKVVAMGLRDAGAEVTYLGLQRTPQEIAAAAVESDAEVVGLSVLSGVHLAVARELLVALESAGRPGLPVVVGGTVPAADVARLLDLGVAAVFPAGSSLPDVVASVLATARERRPAGGR